MTFLLGTVQWLTQHKLDLQVENQRNIANELEWTSCVGGVVRAQDLESSEPKLIKLSFVPGYPGCHKFYVDLIMIDPFPYQMP